MSQTKVQLIEGININTSAPADSLVIDSSGRLGVGTSSPAVILETALNAASGAAARFGLTGQTNNPALSINISEADSTVTFRAGATAAVAQNIVFNNGVTPKERVRIDSSGRLLVGTSTARANFFNSTATAGLQLEGTDYEESSLAIICNNADAGEVSTLTFAQNNGSSVGSNTLVASGDNLGYVSFQGNDGSEFVEAASIKAQVDGNAGINSMPGRLMFSSTPSGSASPVERMRITSDAYVRLASGTGGIQFGGDTAAANALDDYEEGTWTPTLNTGTPSLQSGVYIKIGSFVWLKGQVTYTITNSTTNYLRLGGLPFTIPSDANNRGYQICYIGGLTGTHAWETYDGTGSLALSQNGTTFLGNRTIFSGKNIQFNFFYPSNVL